MCAVWMNISCRMVHFTLSSISIVFLLITLTSSPANAVVYLRSRNVRGPRTWRGGVECIKSIASFYFPESRILRTKTVSVVNLSNLTSPAKEISMEFSSIVNKLLVDEGLLLDTLVRIAADKDTHKQIMDEENFKPVTPSDYYVIVTDSNSKVIDVLENRLKKSIVWSQRAKFLIMFNNPNSLATTGDSQNFVERFFNELHETFDISQVAYAIATGVVTYDIYLSKLYQRNSAQECRKLCPRDMDMFSLLPLIHSILCDDVDLMCP
ncbi:hypothetical protein DMENIID0001_115770 [Sergentomyia squamirostris]